MKSKTPTELTRATGQGLGEPQGNIVRIVLALTTMAPGTPRTSDMEGA
jgi:hypothetical protein